MSYIIYLNILQAFIIIPRVFDESSPTESSPCTAIALPIATFTFSPGNEGDFKFVHVTPATLVRAGVMPVKTFALISKKCREESPVSRRTNARGASPGNLMSEVRWPIYRWHNTSTRKGTMQLRYEDPRDSIATRNQYGVISMMCQYADQTVFPYNWLLRRSQVVDEREVEAELQRTHLVDLRNVWTIGCVQRERIHRNCIILRDAGCGISLFERIYSKIPE